MSKDTTTTRRDTSRARTSSDLSSIDDDRARSVVRTPPGFCPDRRLSDLGVPVVESTDLPPDHLGHYDFVNRRVVIRPGMSAATRRSTLAHELVHVVAGDAYPATWWGRVVKDEVEDDADEIAARELIGFFDLVSVLQDAGTKGEAAEALGVDVETLETRIRTLRPAEARHLRRRTMPMVSAGAGRT